MLHELNLSNSFAHFFNHFLIFELVIVIRVLMLNFKTFYVDKSFHNIYDVICAKS